MILLVNKVPIAFMCFYYVYSISVEIYYRNLLSFSETHFQNSFELAVWKFTGMFIDKIKRKL